MHTFHERGLSSTSCLSPRHPSVLHSSQWPHSFLLSSPSISCPPCAFLAASVSASSIFAKNDFAKNVFSMSRSGVTWPRLWYACVVKKEEAQEVRFRQAWICTCWNCHGNPPNGNSLGQNCNGFFSLTGHMTDEWWRVSWHGAACVDKGGDSDIFKCYKR